MMIASNLGKILLLLPLLAAATMAQAQPEVFTIGNSLTNDTRPQLLDNSEWHIYCGKNLDYIFNNPNGHCIATSNPWPTAFKETQYKYVSVQPFAGTTLAQDRDIIAYWMNLQKSATFVIHSGWSAAVDFPTDFLTLNVGNTMLPSREYMADLIGELKEMFPDRLIIETKANEVLYSIWQDIQNGVGPYDNFRDEMYRDYIHMHTTHGRYLMHNAMRYALRQPLFNRDEFPFLSTTDAIYLEYRLVNTIAVPGDMNRDQKTDLSDVGLFVDSIISRQYDLAADMNRDDVLNLTDIAFFVHTLVNGATIKKNSARI